MLSFLPAFSITTIEVTGVRAMNSNTIHDFVDMQLASGTGSFLSSRAIFSYPRTAIEEAIRRQFPRVRSVRVFRPSLLATAVTIAIEERVPYGRWCVSEICYLLDENGFIFASSTTATSLLSPYTFSGGLDATSSPIGKTFANTSFGDIRSLLKHLTSAGFLPRGAMYMNEKDFTIPLSNGYFLKASFGQDFAQLVKNLELVISSDALKGKHPELEYIDLRFGNRVYYKLRSAE